VHVLDLQGITVATAHSAIPLGSLVANALSGSWRKQPPSWNPSSTELSQLRPVIVATGAGGLIWRKLRETAPGGTTVADEFRDRFRMQVLHHRVHEMEIVEAFSRLRSAGIEPILAKGWAIARLYPERGMRPYGDIDLCVHPDHFLKANALIQGPNGPRAALDVHTRFKRLDRTYEAMYSRSQLVRLGKVEVRVTGPEDHMRLLCVHMLRHGLWKPLWLCDIALVMESQASDFDWNVCLSGNELQSHWVMYSLAMARALLGAKDFSSPGPEVDVPGWAVRALLQQWGTAEHYMRENSIPGFRHNLRELPRALRLRWPNPIQATVAMRARFNSYPRFPLQVAESTRRAFTLLTTLVKRSN
jgi:hypothetical protein